MGVASLVCGCVPSLSDWWVFQSISCSHSNSLSVLNFNPVLSHFSSLLLYLQTLSLYFSIPNPHHLSLNLLPIIPPLRGKTNYINLGSFLIKPVQRVMRYPLLLMELLSATPESHHDRPLLAQALLSIKEINVNINEYKRRKDLGMSKRLYTLVPFQN